jgi:hypothetical protein
MSAIWRKQDNDWRPLLPSGFPSEEALHDLVEDAPHLLPLSGDPTLVVVGREVALGPGKADLVAVEADGRIAVIEIKLRRNAEAKRAVVAQVLTYAAYLKGIVAADLEGNVLRTHLNQRPFASLAEAAGEADQSGEFDPQTFATGVAESLASGSFRLVLVLDEAPVELVQLVGYLESISTGVTVDLIAVSAYELGDEQILVPQRVDPDYAQETATPSRPSVTRRSGRATPVDGTEAFEEAIERAGGQTGEHLRRLLAWARRLEERKLATLKSVLGEGREILLLWLPGEKAGLVSIWNDRGAYISLWRSVFVRHAWEQIEPIERLLDKPIGQGNTVANPPEELLDLLTTAYERAADSSSEWDGKSYYSAFGEGPERNWDDARDFGFVAAGGGAWYSKTLKQLDEGDRVFVYIPKGNGVGGYVGVGTVTGRSRQAKDFLVEKDGRQRPLPEVTRADIGRGGTTDPDLAEWVVPVRWIKALPREEAIRDSDFFANQNSAVKLTHGYTLRRLTDAFGLERPTEQDTGSNGSEPAARQRA